MLDRIDAFIRDLAGARTEDDLDGLLAEISREMGFTYFAVTHHVDLHGLAAPAIRLANYPADWVDYFDRNGLGPCDPVHRASQLTSVGFPWSRLPELIRLSARDREVLDLAARRGIGEGFTVPAHVPGEANGSCSFATKTGQPLHEGRLPLAQLAGAFAFEAARKVWRMHSPDPKPRPQLTDRQRDCVVWVARGKSDWEISRILGLSPETVTEYLKRARERYGVSKRTMLAVHALFDGTISFTDVLRN
ncbi:MAG TPA: LuxR family transcriptional regulator [Geminicoccaceae bacterium]|jgi:LuxR family quorum-sensing system transcriptional regulator CciR|nr:LuxR family transcriptional regulator [Geminicoccaceae bacterium]